MFSRTALKSPPFLRRQYEHGRYECNFKAVTCGYIICTWQQLCFLGGVLFVATSLINYAFHFPWRRWRGTQITPTNRIYQIARWTTRPYQRATFRGRMMATSTKAYHKRKIESRGAPLPDQQPSKHFALASDNDPFSLERPGTMASDVNGYSRRLRCGAFLLPRFCGYWFCHHGKRIWGWRWGIRNRRLAGWAICIYKSDGYLFLIILI